MDIMDTQVAATSNNSSAGGHVDPLGGQNQLANSNIVENGMYNVKSNSNYNHSNHGTVSKHHEAKERKFDLNSFSSVKLEAAEDDEDDKPLAVRKQKPVSADKLISNDHCLPNRTIKDSELHHPSKPKPDLHQKHINKEQPNEKSHKTEQEVFKKKDKDERHEEKKRLNNEIKLKQEDKDKLRKTDVDRNLTELKSSKEIENEKSSKKRPKVEVDDEDELPLAQRSVKSKQVKSEEAPKKRKKHSDDDEDYEDRKSIVKKTKVMKAEVVSPKAKAKEGGRKKKEEEPQEVWKWWEEQNHKEGIKWKYLEHKGPLFAPPYVPLPSSVHFYYDGKPMKLSEETEEVATFYSKMIEHDYVKQEAFNKNFFHDWRKVMTAKEKEVITDLNKCDFKELHAHFTKLSEERKARSKEEKQMEKEKMEKIQKEYGIAIVDGHKEKIGNFKIEPPGLFRGRGTHPKMGMLKRRVQPEDVMINCSKDSKIPEPPAGHKWKEVRFDNTVTWLASWNENIMGGTKYVMLNPSSKIKGEKDWQKYETARKLKSKAHKIRETYKEDWKSKEMKIRQRAVALYFIDKLALRAGNEKEEGETADTVGCCSLRCEHIKLHEELDGQEWVVEFDFLGKDCIRYYNKIPVEKRVFKNLKLFMENKNPGDDLFDRLNTSILNKHLNSLMEGLTAKVFRTYNASFTLQQQLDMLTKEDMSAAEKLLSYNRANRQVAILCNHQRSVPKAHGKQMELLQEKIDEKVKAVKHAKGELKDAKKAYKESKSEKNKKLLEQKEKQYERLHEQLQKLQVKATDKEENKEISLGTSKLNYLDPRISIAWCKKWNVPIEKIYNKTQREKFRWAIDMADSEFKW